MKLQRVLPNQTLSLSLPGQIWGFSVLTQTGPDSTWGHDEGGQNYPLPSVKVPSGRLAWGSLQLTNIYPTGAAAAGLQPPLAALLVAIAESREEVAMLPNPPAAPVTYQRRPLGGKLLLPPKSITVAGGAFVLGTFYPDPGFVRVAWEFNLQNATGTPSAVTIGVNDDEAGYTWTDTIPAGVTQFYEILQGVESPGGIQPGATSTAALQSPSILTVPKRVMALSGASLIITTLTETLTFNGTVVEF